MVSGQVGGILLQKGRLSSRLTLSPQGAAPAAFPSVTGLLVVYQFPTPLHRPEMYHYRSVPFLAQLAIAVIHSGPPLGIPDLEI